MSQITLCLPLASHVNEQGMTQVALKKTDYNKENFASILVKKNCKKVNYMQSVHKKKITQ